MCQGRASWLHLPHEVANLTVRSEAALTPGGACAQVPFQGLGEQVALKSYDVGDSCDALDQCVHTCGLSGWTRHTLELRENEMVMLEKNRCIDMDVKVPYAQLGSVDYHKGDARPGRACAWSPVAHLFPAIAAQPPNFIGGLRLSRGGHCVRITDVECNNFPCSSVPNLSKYPIFCCVYACGKAVRFKR